MAQLNWRGNIDSVVSVLTEYCYLLKVIERNVGVGAVPSVIYSCVQSRLWYGVIKCGNSIDSQRVLGNLHT